MDLVHEARAPRFWAITLSSSSQRIMAKALNRALEVRLCLEVFGPAAWLRVGGSFSLKGLMGVGVVLDS